MYSEVSNRNLVGAFLVNTLDPQPIGTTGGSSKEDFLSTRSFLKHVDFPGRTKLHNLIFQLAKLFAVHYQTVPTPKERETAQQLQSHAPSTPSLWEAYFGHTVYVFDTGQKKLEDHSATIALFDEALSECSLWPDSDHGKKQFFTPRPVSEVVKSGWHTTAERLQKNRAAHKK
jgi:hypothetical protein